MISRLRHAVDWRMQVITARLDALAAGTAALAADQRDLGERLGRATAELGELRAQVTALHPIVRAIADEDAANRRRLFALRGEPGYEEPFEDPDPLVSITVATRDRPDLLCRRAIPSLLAQTHATIEVIVVGDAASDETADAVAAVGDPRVRFANLTQHLTAHADPRRHWLVGSAMARNEAARLARGRWLLHFDDDDALHPDAVAALLALARRERAEVAYGGFVAHGAAGRTQELGGFPPREGAFGWQGALVHSGLRFFERELIAADLEVPGDVYLLGRMLRAGVRFAQLDRPVWDYHPSQLRG